MKKKRRGRPRKEKDRIEPWQFARAAIAMSAYDEARGKGQKHSAALEEVVKFVKQRNPDLPISETEVRRILAAFRPRNSRTILRFERSPLNKEERLKFRWIQEELAALHQKKGILLPAPSDVYPPRTVTTFKIRIAERPNYPRFNRKPPSE